jgi:hypothetical protein
MNRNEAARVIQRGFRRRFAIRLPRNVRNAITANNLGPRVVEAWNQPGGDYYYMNPSTFVQLLQNGVFISPFTRRPASFAFRDAVEPRSA